jgi:hypothetical protein
MSNNKLTEARLRQVVGMICNGIMMKSAHAKALQVSTDTLRSWDYRSNSNPNDPAFLFDFFDTGEPISYAKAISISKKFAYLSLREACEQYSIHGRERLTLYKGAPVVAMDKRALPLDRDTRILMGYHPEAMLLDENGDAVFVTEHVDAPEALLDKLLSTFPDLQTKTHQTVALSGAVMHGVQVTKKPDYSLPPPPIPELQIMSDPPTTNDLSDLLGEPVRNEVDQVVRLDTESMSSEQQADAPDKPADVANISVDGGPPAPDPEQRPRSRLEEDLLERLRGRRLVDEVDEDHPSRHQVRGIKIA